MDASALIDASFDDGAVGPDAPPAVGDVTVSYLKDTNLPGAGYEVIFHDPDGSVRGRTTTDANGNAHGEVMRGGMVTVVGQWFSIKENVTIMDVAPGDHLELGRDWNGEVGTGTFVGAIDVALPTTVDGAHAYRMENGCSVGWIVEPATTGTVGTYETCPENASVLVVAQTSTGTPLAWAAVHDVPLATGPVALGSWSTGWRNTVVTVTNMPSEMTGAYMPAYIKRGARGYTLRGVPTANVDGFNTASTTFTSPLGFADLFEVPVSLISSVSDPNRGRILRRRSSSAPTEVLIDAAADYLSLVEEVRVDVSVDPTRPKGIVTVDGDLGPADAAYVRYSWTGANWTIVFPVASGLEAVTPQLPADLAASAPSVDSTITNVRGGILDLEGQAYPQLRLSGDRWVFRAQSGAPPSVPPFGLKFSAWQ